MVTTTRIVLTGCLLGGGVLSTLLATSPHAHAQNRYPLPRIMNVPNVADEHGTIRRLAAADDRPSFEALPSPNLEPSPVDQPGYGGVERGAPNPQVNDFDQPSGDRFEVHRGFDRVRVTPPEPSVYTSSVARSELETNDDGLPGSQQRTVDGKPWWIEAVYRPQRPQLTPTPVTLEQLLASSLVHSPYVRVIKEVPLVRETSVMEADAQFDWVSFIDTLWSDLSDPVGSRLTTGGPDRLRDDNFTTTVGVRRKNQYGGQVEIGQKIGHQNTNSIFFVPANQGTSRFTINYTQPLLRNAGRAYNTALTVLAALDVEVAQADFSEQLQTHLVEVTRAYWDLYLQRANLLQKQRLLTAAKEILVELERRSEIDALRSQIVRARAAVERRKADILRSETEVKNAESRIRTLVNDPVLGTSIGNELIPQDLPLAQPWDVDEVTSVETAIQNRPEVVRVMRQIRAAGVRLNVAKNELLPALNLIIDTYVAGLRGNSNIGNAWLDQWRTGEPSYGIGLQYEFPIWNRAAQARYQRRRIELRQLESQLKATIENLRLDVEVAVREVATTHGEMNANLDSMVAAEADVNYLYDRWQTLPGSERTSSLFLEDLLDAQERLNAAEFAYLDSQNKFSISHMQYLKAVGTLLNHENISVEQFCECHLPSLALKRYGGSKYQIMTEPQPQPTEPFAASNSPRDATPSPERFSANGVQNANDLGSPLVSQEVTSPDLEPAPQASIRRLGPTQP